MILFIFQEFPNIRVKKITRTAQRERARVREKTSGTKADKVVKKRKRETTIYITKQMLHNIMQHRQVLFQKVTKNYF